VVVAQDPCGEALPEKSGSASFPGIYAGLGPKPLRINGLGGHLEAPANKIEVELKLNAVTKIADYFGGARGIRLLSLGVWYCAGRY
jgi:hypothetical protein